MKYKIEIEKPTGEIVTYIKLKDVPLLFLLRAVEKCEIKSFKVSL